MPTLLSKGVDELQKVCILYYKSADNTAINENRDLYAPVSFTADFTFTLKAKIAILRKVCFMQPIAQTLSQCYFLAAQSTG